MCKVEDFILGNSALHDRFRAIAKILGIMVTISPRSASLEQLETYTGYPEKVLSKLCDGLWQADLLQPDSEVEDTWLLGCEPDRITLEDVYHCAIGKSQGGARSALSTAERAHDDVDLLIMQATIAINQSMLQHLRRFPLNRLQIRSGGIPPLAECAEQDMPIDEPG